MPETFNGTRTKLTTTNITTAYQSPNVADANRVIVLSVMATNIDGAAAHDITLVITNSADTEQSKWVSTIPVPADAAIELVSNKLVLLRGEKLRATASSANKLDVTVSVLEIT